MIELDKQKLAVIMSGFNIPAKPEILNKIQLITQSEDPKLSKLADLISKDVGLSSAILKTINSPYFGMHRKISNIKQTVMFLGMSRVESIVTCLLLKQAFIGKSCISLERFWDHASDVANAMLFIGDFIKDRVPLEKLYTIGLFHDCGIAAMSIKYCDYKETLIEANQSKSSLIDIENKKYNTNHAVIGYLIANTWNLPERICTSILQHHSHDFLEKAIDDERLMYAFSALKAAENMVEVIKRNSETYDWAFIKKSCLAMIGITDEQYENVCKKYIEINDAL